MMKTIRTLILALLACFSLVAQAALSPAQVAALKTTCLADTVTCKPLHDAADDVGLAAYFNTDTVTYIVWRPSVTDREIMASAEFDWTRVDNLTNGKARIWEYLLRFGTIDPSKANVRAGIDATWVGTQADLNVRAAVYLVCKRSATRAEKALASGSGTTNSPSVMTFTGSVTVNEASTIRS